jgi:putative sigma-54 modulation protein
MQIQIHSIHFDADQKLLTFIDEKMKKLFSIYGDIISGEVFLKIEKSDSRDNKVTEIKLAVPGNDLFAGKQSKSFEESTDLAIEALKRQIEKHKMKAVK